MVIVEEIGNMENITDMLSDMFSRSLNLQIKNTTPFALYMKEGSVCSAQTIRENTIIGEIRGDPCYIWELDHCDYIIIDKELVLNTRPYKDSIISYIREENETSNTSNCFVMLAMDQNGQARFLLATKRAVQPSEELVYSTFDFKNGNEA